jgi:protein gp37
MAETSAIEWTDATVNFWWGCTKVSPGCDNCYAETWNAFRGNGLWGPGAPRRPIKGAAALLRRLNNTADTFESQHGRPRRVFMQSMSDVFDNEVDDSWTLALCRGAEDAPRLRIQMLTKRIGNVEKRVPDGWRIGGWPPHIGLMISICTNAEARRDVKKLRDLKKRLGIPWVGISAEPMLEPLPDLDLTDIDWCIVGGESGKHARPTHPRWVQQIRDRAARSGTAFFFKQWGEWLPDLEAPADLLDELRRTRVERQELHSDPNPFATMRFDTRTFYRAGKKRSGSLLDGNTYHAFPKEILR